MDRSVIAEYQQGLIDILSPALETREECSGVENKSMRQRVMNYLTTYLNKFGKDKDIRQGLLSSTSSLTKLCWPIFEDFRYKAL